MNPKLEVTRVFNAPVELVWKTWTEPALVMRW
ncbi:MAG: Activator of Hsp90 ATPase 1-like protein, partial [Mucilaginibacter sp.]|nr:Activator of Hsp90 ATPase 1-like protein [Mucilaginibacter sp.]